MITEVTKLEERFLQQLIKHSWKETDMNTITPLYKFEEDLQSTNITITIIAGIDQDDHN
jgi:hypothetical protein